MNIDMEYLLNMMKKYMDIPSPGGYTKIAIEEARLDFEKLGLKTVITKKGALIATLEGKNTEEEIIISAHMDTLGAMVKEIEADGKLKYKRIGGGCFGSIEGENCHIITESGREISGSVMPRTASTHIYGQEVANLSRNENNMIIRIDEKVETKKDVLNIGINVGDFIYMDTRTKITESGFVKSRYLDNKLAVAMVFEVCRYLKENKITPCCTTKFYISNYEEMGHGVSGNNISDKVKEMVAIDIAPVGKEQESSEYAVTIAAKDRKSVYDYELRRKLSGIAKENNIDYRVDVFNFYSSDATHVILQGGDFKFACIGPGVDSTHHYERTHFSAIENNVKLLVKYIENN